MSNKVAFTPYEIKSCLFDIERTKNLKAAIEATVRKDDIVVEAGGGTGILSMFALQAGAKHVYVIELSDRFTNVIRSMAKANGYEDKITVINGDATETDIPELVDVYISELLSTGLFFEPQIQAYNNLRRFFKPSIKCIPQSVTSTISFAYGKQELFGFDIGVDSYLRDDIEHQYITYPKNFHHVVFDGKEVNSDVSFQDGVSILNTGMVNSFIIESEANLSGEIIAGQSDFLFNPELVFLKECPCKDIWRKNEMLDYRINYVAGGDTLDINMEIW